VTDELRILDVNWGVNNGRNGGKSGSRARKRKRESGSERRKKRRKEERSRITRRTLGLWVERDKNKWSVNRPAQ
jgi:hypothetical protein